MPLLSLPLPRIPGGIVENLPIRVPFPFMRIASILPHAINEPIKSSLMALFRLAWSAKIQIPVLITVVFMACDIRLQLEINIFWETNNRPHALHGSNRNTGGQRRASREDMRRAALVAAALYQQQRRRLIQEMRAQHGHGRHETTAADGPPLPPNAPLATEEDSDLEGSHDGNFYETDTLTCSHRSTTSEAGSFGSNEDETEDAEEKSKKMVTKRKRKSKRSRPSSREPDEDDDEEDEDSTTDEEDDDNDDENGGGMNGGSSSHGGGGYRDDAFDDDDSDDMDDSSHADVGGGYNSPLVLEIELRHRPLDPPSNENADNRRMGRTQRATFSFKNSNIFSLCFKEQHNLRTVNGDKRNFNFTDRTVPRILL